MKKEVTYDRLIDMLKERKDKVGYIYVEECYGGSLDIFVGMVNEEETENDNETL